MRVDQVIWAVKSLAFPTIQKNAYLAVRADLNNAPVAMLTKKNHAVFAGHHSVRADKRPGRRITGIVCAARSKDRHHLSIGRPLTHDISNHIAEPKHAAGLPQRSFRKLESTGNLLDFGGSGNQFVQRRIKSDD